MMKKPLSRTLAWCAAASALVGAGYLAGSRTGSTTAPEASALSHSRTLSGSPAEPAVRPAQAASGVPVVVEPSRDSGGLPFAAAQTEPPAPVQPVVTDLPPEFLATAVPRQMASASPRFPSAAGSPVIPQQRQAPAQPARVLSYAVDPAAPGNSMAHSGMEVAVDERLRTDSAGNAAEALGVSITPQAESQAATVAGVETGGSGSSRENRDRSSATGQTGDAPIEAVSRFPDGTTLTPRQDFGFTPEEELFRTKWGWLAFDQARTAAKQEASNR